MNIIVEMTVSRRLYFDNAATSFPKPPGVASAMLRYMNEIGASPGRGSYREALESARIVDRCRQLIHRLIHGEPQGQVVFTLNCTDALNLAIKGIARHHSLRGETVHIITTALDHNSILRPLRELERHSVHVSRVPVDPGHGCVEPGAIAAAMTRDTRLVAITHASNVTGVLQPIAEIGGICRGRGVPFLVDAAQSLGHVPLDVHAMFIDMLAFPGHKGMLGPLGTGGLYLGPAAERIIETLREGGTGSASESDTQPTRLPDRYEPGSGNGPGVAGLAEAVAWILERSVESLHAHEQMLTAILVNGLRAIDKVRVLGPIDPARRSGVVSFTLAGHEPTDVVAILEEHFGVLGRSGLHCAPLAHRVYGTADAGGAVRLSVGPFLSEEDVGYAVSSVAEIAREQSHASVVHA